MSVNRLNPLVGFVYMIGVTIKTDHNDKNQKIEKSEKQKNKNFSKSGPSHGADERPKREPVAVCDFWVSCSKIPNCDFILQTLDIIGEVLKRADKHSRLDMDKEGNIPIMNAIESLNVNLCHELLKEEADQQLKANKVGYKKTQKKWEKNIECKN